MEGPTRATSESGDFTATAMTITARYCYGNHCSVQCIIIMGVLIVIGHFQWLMIIIVIGVSGVTDVQGTHRGNRAGAFTPN